MRQFLLTALAIGAGALCCACSAPATVSITLDETEQEQLLLDDLQANTPTPGPDDGVAPLTIIRAVESCGDGYIVYPKVLYCAHGEEINQSICDITAQRAESVCTAIFTQYRIEYNRNGLFSLRMELYDLYGDGNELLKTLFFTFDVATGRLCGVGDLLDRDDTRWRGIMPDIVMAQAEAQGITLLNDVMPIGDDQKFYITQDELVLAYELYEIATWSAGAPEFAIPISQLSDFIPADSPLKKVELESEANGWAEAPGAESAAAAEPPAEEWIPITVEGDGTAVAEAPAEEAAPEAELPEGGEAAAEEVPASEEAEAAQGERPMEPAVETDER